MRARSFISRSMRSRITSARRRGRSISPIATSCRSRRWRTMRCCGWRGAIARRRSRALRRHSGARVKRANPESRANHLRIPGPREDACPGMTGLKIGSPPSMNLHRLLNARRAAGKPVRVALIGAGKFGSMFLSQVPHTPGLEIPVIVDLDPQRAREACRTVGWDDQRIAATTFTADAAKATSGHIEVIVEATGNPAVGIKHARAAIAAGKHIVMVNVEADVLAGPLLADEARKAGVVYSLAYGDQPALTAEMVDWARATGFRVVAAGKGTKYLPAYHDVTPTEVWSHYGLTAGEAQSAGMNPQMFNSFLDGTKSAIEMAAIANATGLDVPSEGLLFPPCGVDDLPHVMRPRAKGGVLEKSGVVA